MLVATLASATLLYACECGKKGVPGDWVARVSATAGTVSIKTAVGESVRRAKVDDYLRVGGSLITDKDGKATLVLRNGGKLDVSPNTTLTLSSDKPTRKVDLKLLSGSVESTASKVAASELVINVGGRKVRLGSAAKATVTLPEGWVKRAAVVVSFGTASVDRQDGVTQKVVAGETLNLTLAAAKPKPKPDAGVRADVSVVTASPIVFYLKSTGHGRVLYRKPGERRFSRLRRPKTVPITPGTELELARGASVQVGLEKDKGMTLRGPAELIVRASGEDASGEQLLRVESKAGDLAIRKRGEVGKRGGKLSVDGVTIATRVTWKRIDVDVKRARGVATVVVRRGVALLTDASGKVTRVEAGQNATIKNGAVYGPTQPPLARLQVERPGAIRVFNAARRTPVSLRWDRGQGDVLVEVARNSAFRGALFADVIKRNALTLPSVPRGALYWRIRPLQGGTPTKGTQGSLSLLVDTSHRVLKSRPPRNTITPTNTRVYYQNALPRFTFSWQPIAGAVRYQFKIFRERNLSKPLVRKDTRRTTYRLRRPLSEGRYLWYISGRDRRGKVLRGMSGRTLTIRYDNATPNLQIVYPRNGLTVSKATLEVRGVTIRGSRVFVNGAAATLDEAYRFWHTVSLKPGANRIVFRVEDKRRGSSIYLRHVTRR
ncbi:MAG: hypothetical protein CSA24_00435 [Deltaproteobacteria bacterium]|nr:MAG: hypothetical protein CSB49_00515 [Pseudomonadota bacterium]PIE66308.1 MAG: hypothetical protein CSA24_00435 [Deltaproteobacteria bacterium]